MKRTITLLIAALCLISLPLLADTKTSAANANNISADVTKNCTISTFSINFGTYDPMSATDDDQTATIDVYCTKGTSASVTLSNGSNFAVDADAALAGYAAITSWPHMKVGSNTLAYMLFSDSGHTTPWQTATAPSVSFGSSTSKNTVMQKTVYARIPAGYDAAPATGYVDTVTATVTY